MASEWAEIDSLIRELGAVRAAGFAARASHGAYAAIEQAISEATEAVVDTLSAPQDGQLLARAHEAIEVVADILATVDDELVRSLRVRARGATLRSRARELIAQARSR